ncbi:MAG: AmpG family muropeptide MFS transporter [Halioglobus sp.]
MGEQAKSWRDSVFNRRMLICVFTGFASGMPLYVLFQLVPAWLREGGVSLAEIGLFALVGIPYTWKFVWAPLMDRWVPPFLGRRRGWMFMVQLGLLLSIGVLGAFQPEKDIAVIAWIAFAVAFFSASQDIALDAYRREILPDEELGLGNSIHVQAYRISSLVPGSLSLILADSLPWSSVFWITAGFMLIGLAMSLLVAEPESEYPQAVGLREAVIAPFREYLQRRGLQGVLLVLGFMFLYKIGDNMATALATPFYLDMGFTKTEIGLVAKHAALWPAIIGGLLGGGLMIRLGINRSLWLFGVVQVVSILGFALLASVGHSLGMLAAVISFEYLGVGMGTAAFTAFIARETSKVYAATQFALFTALAALPRTFANASTGVIVEQVGWVHFFLLCALLAIPGMILLFWVAPWRDTPQRLRRGKVSEQTLIIHAGMRKTGTTAIQNYLHEYLDHPDYEYFSTNIPNSSLIIVKAFNHRKGVEGGKIMDATGYGRSGARKRFVARLARCHKPNVILSAESISSLNKGECEDLLHVVSEQFNNVKVVLYLRPIKSKIESGFQETLKHQFVTVDKPHTLNLKKSTQKYDEVFGEDNVTLRFFEPASFPNRSVVNDFLTVVGIDNVTLPLRSSNTGLSMQAVQLLYLYRKEFPVSIREDKVLIRKLSGLAGDKFRMHPDLLNEILDERNAHYDWFESRSGFSLQENWAAHEGPMVRSEADLLDVPMSSLKWLAGQVGGTDSVPLAAYDHAAIALSIRRLALSA